ncbi:MAG: ADP-ribosylglycohydrolase family protein, partial [Anaerolineaceae bacterium]|nr:ADP-ribosylglycohydrolase family protein [Anaerolineaceae bacterium]
LLPGQIQEITWTVPELNNMPIFSAGIEILSPAPSVTLYLDYLTWDGVPKTTFSRPAGSKIPHPGPTLWRQSWVNAVDQWETWASEAFRIIQNEGRGLLTTGMREWQDYRVSASITPALLNTGGLAVRVQGLLRYYALELTAAQTIRLVRCYDGEITILAETPCPWERWKPIKLSLQAQGSHLCAWVADQPIFDLTDPDSTLSEGAIGLVLEEGHLLCPAIQVEPV